MIDQKKRSVLDIAGEKFRDKISKDPSHFIQPTMHIEERTGQEYINPEYVKRYGNPYNEVNTKSIYLEKSEKDIAQKQRSKAKRDYSIDYMIMRTQWLMKHVYEEDHSPQGITCRTCLARNHKDNIHCFWCSEPIIYTKYNL